MNKRVFSRICLTLSLKTGTSEIQKWLKDSSFSILFSVKFSTATACGSEGYLLSWVSLSLLLRHHHFYLCLSPSVVRFQRFVLSSIFRKATINSFLHAFKCNDWEDGKGKSTKARLKVHSPV